MKNPMKFMPFLLQQKSTAVEQKRAIMTIISLYHCIENQSFVPPIGARKMMATNLKNI